MPQRKAGGWAARQKEGNAIACTRPCTCRSKKAPTSPAASACCPSRGMPVSLFLRRDTHAALDRSTDQELAPARREMNGGGGQARERI